MPHTSPEALENIRHSLAHLLAAAVLKKFPNAKLGIGPVIEHGFYYDFKLPRSLNPEDLREFEKIIRDLIRENLPFSGKKISAAEAKKLFKDQPFKLDLIKELTKAPTLRHNVGGRSPDRSVGKKKPLTVYETAESKTSSLKPKTYLLDLCRGGHVKNTSEINPDAFKLTSIAGAYWRGDEKNPQLQRIYGVAFGTKKGLDEYLELQKEIEKRDHRVLGQRLDLFTFSPLVGSGLPLFTPKGTIIRTELQNAVLEISKKYDMQPVTIPHIAKRELYKLSGHAEKFGDELIKVVSHYDEFVMKPVNCPHHIQIYASRPRSYKDLPIRYMESTAMYRDEKPGEIGGLTRVRAITVDDGHIFCAAEHIKDEAKKIARIIEEFYKGVGMWENHWVSLSVRNPKTPRAYIGEPKDWDKAEKMLKQVSDELQLNAKKIEGEAAIYGPKLDYMFKDALGREIQLATIQLDFAMPKRFELAYINNKGRETTPVMIHRAILGSYERFLAILIEHFGGAFPLWLAPIQVAILPVGEKFASYSKELFEKIREHNIRVEISDANETLGKRVREAELQKIPYILVIGEKEAKNNSVNVRHYRRGQEGEIKLEALIQKIKGEVSDKVI